MGGRARTVYFESVWTKGSWSQYQDAFGYEQSVQPGYDDGQPKRGIDRRESDQFDYAPDNRVTWAANISDVVGNRSGVNPYTFVRTKGGFVQVSGLQFSSTGTLVWTCKDVCMGGLYTVADPRSYFPALTSVEKVKMVNDIIMLTNPSRPVTSLPTFIAELKEFPGMMFDGWDRLVDSLNKVKALKDWSRKRTIGQLLAELINSDASKPVISTGVHAGSPNLRRGLTFLDCWTAVRRSLPQLGKDNLTYRWGIQPLVSDICRLLRFQKQVNSRLKRLNDLYRRGQTSKRVTLPARPEVRLSDTQVALKTTNGFTRAISRWSAKERVWGTARWRLPAPTVPPSWLRAENQRELAENLVLGLTNREVLSTLWELTPSSWLADWFYGLGDYISAHNNALGLVCDNVCIMRHLRTDQRWTVTQKPSWLHETRNVPGFYEVKMRDSATIPVVLPVFSLPVLTNGQWSVVASLALSQRGRRG